MPYDLEVIDLRYRQRVAKKVPTSLKVKLAKQDLGK
jgi:hypothetical protein